MRSSVLSLISFSLRQKMNYPIMHLQHNSISVVRQYIETSQQYKMETMKIVSSMQLYSQLDKHVSRLAASAINDDRHCRSAREQEIEDGLATSKALNESRPRRLSRPRHLMCLVLPTSGNSAAPASLTCSGREPVNSSHRKMVCRVDRRV